MFGFVHYRPAGTSTTDPELPPGSSPLPVVTFDGNGIDVLEGEFTAVVGIVVSPAPTYESSVVVRAVNGAAVAGEDYTFVSQVVTFAPGQTRKTVELQLHAGQMGEAEYEAFSLQLQDASWLTVGDPSKFTVTIRELPSVQFERAEYTFDEVEGEVTVAVVQNFAQATATSVWIDAHDGTAVRWPLADYEFSQQVLQFAPGETRKEIPIRLHKGQAGDIDREYFSLWLYNPDGAGLGEQWGVQVNIVRPPTIQFERSSYAFFEDEANPVVAVVMSSEQPALINVWLEAISGTAVAGQDFTFASRWVTFAPGETRHEIPIPLATGDGTGEPDSETFKLRLSTPSGALLGANVEAAVEIKEVPTVQFESAAYSVTETSSTVTAVVTLSSSVALPVTVQVSAEDGSAVAGADYTFASQALTFLPGQTRKEVTVQILQNDDQGASSEFFLLRLSRAIGVALGTPAETAVTIEELPIVQFERGALTVARGDGTATGAVTLAYAPASPVTVQVFAVSGTALVGSDYAFSTQTVTFAAGETRKEVTAQILAGDANNAVSEAFKLLLSNPSGAAIGPVSELAVTITQPPDVQFESSAYTVFDAEGDVTLAVVLSYARPEPVNVVVTATPGTALSGTDYTFSTTSLVFLPGETRKEVTAQILPRESGDAATETFTMQLSEPSGVDLGAVATATVSIKLSPDVQFESATYSVFENAGTASAAVVLSAAQTVPVTVQVDAYDGTAVSGADYAFATQVLTFAAGETRKTVAVQIQPGDDGTSETEYFVLHLSNPTVARLGTITDAQVTIKEPTSVQFESATFKGYEFQGEVTVVVTAFPAPVETAKVWIRAVSSTAAAGEDYTFAARFLTFDPGETRKEVTVQLLSGDDGSNTHEYFDMELSSPSGAALGAQASTRVSIAEYPEVRFESAMYTVYESDGVATVAVVVSPPPPVEARVWIDAKNGTATEGGGADYSFNEALLTFAPGETRKTVNVTINQGVINDRESESFSMFLYSPVGIEIVDPAEATITILDGQRPT